MKRSEERLAPTTAVFTEAEVDYLNSQPLGRVATVGRDGKPHVTPVGVFYEPETEAIVIGGVDMAASKKFRDARRQPEVAVVGGAHPPPDPRAPHRGEEVGERLGAGFRFSPAWIRIRPRRILSWGIAGDSFELTARDVPDRGVDA
jgi:pyridoxamine 5'-phosphate oxidase family protein